MMNTVVSSDDNKDNIMKCIKHGARDYILKPLRLQEIKNIWQHVVRKKADHSAEKSGDRKEIRIMDQHRKSNSQMIMIKKRIDGNLKSGASSSSRGKKPRLSWNSELHDKFVDAVQRLAGSGNYRTPFGILDC